MNKPVETLLAYLSVYSLNGIGEIFVKVTLIIVFTNYMVPKIKV